MAAPSFVAAGTGSTDAGGAWTHTCVTPAAAGNLIIVQILQDGGSSAVLSSVVGTNIENLAGTDNTWTVLLDGGHAVGASAEAWQHIFIGRSLSTSAPTISGANSTSEDLYIRSYEFSGVNTGTTLDTVVENAVNANKTLWRSNGTGTTVEDASVVTTGADRLALNFVAVNDDLEMFILGGATNGPWVLQTQYATASGTDGAIGLQTRTLASAATVDGGSFGIGATVAWGAVGFALIPAASGPATHQGSVTFPITYEPAEIGRLTARTSLTSPFTFDPASVGRLNAKASLTSPFTWDAVTNGARKTLGAIDSPFTWDAASAAYTIRPGTVTSPFTFDAATAARITARSSVTLPITWDSSTDSVHTLVGSATFPITWTANTDGEIVAGAIYGAAALELVWDASTDSVRTTYATVDSPFVWDAATVGRLTALASVDSPFTWDAATAARLLLPGSVTAPFTWGTDSQGIRLAYGQVDSPFTWAVDATGRLTALSSVTFPVTWDAATSSLVVMFGSVTVPLVWDTDTNGFILGDSIFGAVALDLIWDTATEGYRSQFARAATDSNDGNWTDQDGGANLTAAIDEVDASDTDYIKSEPAPVASACRVKLAGMSDPATSSGYTLHWRIGKDTADDTINMTLTLYEGGGDVLGAGTEIASRNRNDVTTSLTTFTEPLSAAEIDAITDHSALYLEFEATAA